MLSTSFRNVLVACVVAAVVGFAIPNLQSIAGAAPIVSPTEALPLQDSRCGDGRCSPPEDCNTCSRDCGSCCGDRRCAPPEDCRSCPGDCGPC